MYSEGKFTTLCGLKLYWEQSQNTNFNPLYIFVAHRNKQTYGGRGNHCKEINMPFGFSEESLSSLMLRYVNCKTALFFFPFVVDLFLNELYSNDTFDCYFLGLFWNVYWSLVNFAVPRVTHFFLMTAKWCVFSKTPKGVWPPLTSGS